MIQITTNLSANKVRIATNIFLSFFQAIAIACCFMGEGPVLVVCPAILRFSWAEELERWLPFCTPADIHLGTIMKNLQLFC